MKFTNLSFSFVLACVFEIACCAGHSAHGAQLNVLNPSFDDLTGPPNSADFDSNGHLLVDHYTDIAFGPNPVPSWTVTGADAGTVNSSFYPPGLKDGQNLAFIGGTFGGGAISQTLTDTLAVGTYTLDVNIGNLGVIAYAGYDVQLLAGSTILSEDNNTLSPAPYAFSTSELTYTATPANPSLGLPLTILLTAIAPGHGSQTNFDNVQLFHNVPEPGTFVLAGMGAIGFTVARRRRRRALHAT